MTVKIYIPENAYIPINKLYGVIKINNLKQILDDDLYIPILTIGDYHCGYTPITQKHTKIQLGLPTSKWIKLKDVLVNFRPAGGKGVVFSPLILQNAWKHKDIFCSLPLHYDCQYLCTFPIDLKQLPLRFGVSNIDTYIPYTIFVASGDMILNTDIIPYNKVCLDYTDVPLYIPKIYFEVKRKLHNILFSSSFISCKQKPLKIYPVCHSKKTFINTIEKLSIFNGFYSFLQRIYNTYIQINIATFNEKLLNKAFLDILLGHLYFSNVIQCDKLFYGNLYNGFLIELSFAHPILSKFLGIPPLLHHTKRFTYDRNFYLLELIDCGDLNIFIPAVVKNTSIWIGKRINKRGR